MESVEPNAKYSVRKKVKFMKGKEQKRRAKSTPIVGSEYCVPYKVKLRLQSKVLNLRKYILSFSGDEGKINWEFIMDYPGKLFNNKYTMVDSQGKVIMTLQNAKTFVQARWKVYKGDSTDEKDLLFTVKKPRVFWKSDMEVYLPSTKEEDGACDFKIIAEWLSQSFVIQKGERIIARSKNVKDGGWFTSDYYSVTVAPGVDSALIAALVLLTYEIKTGGGPHLLHGHGAAGERW